MIDMGLTGHNHGTVVARTAITSVLSHRPQYRQRKTERLLVG
jgi:hypothetical protein